MSKTLLLLLLSSLLWSCSAQTKHQIPDRNKNLTNVTVIPADAQPVDSISFKRDAAYGNTNNVSIGAIGKIAVDDSGRVFIVDSKQKTIHVFEPDGHFITNLGSKGKGPGEFESVIGLKALDNQLYMYDIIQHRINIFSLDSLKFSHAIDQNLSQEKGIQGLKNYFAMQVYFINKNRFLVKYRNLKFGSPESAKSPEGSVYNRYYFMNSNGNILPGMAFEQYKDIYLKGTVKGHNYMIVISPLLGQSLISVSHKGQIYSAWSENFLIKVRNSEGKYLYAFSHPFKKLTLTREAALESVGIVRNKMNLAQKIIKQSVLPQTWPALRSMKIDSKNRIWASTIVKNQSVYEWWVISPKGRLLARFTWPEDKPVQIIKNGFMYVRELNNDTGNMEIAQYRIKMEPLSK